MTLVWVSNMIPRPPAKRAAAIGIVNGVGNLGNLYVSPRFDFTFTHSTPKYWLLRLESSMGPRYEINLICFFAVS